MGPEFDDDGPNYVFRIETPSGPAAGHWLVADLGVTAAHCLPGAKKGDSLDLHALDGPSFSGTVELVDELRDVIVIRVHLAPTDTITRAAPPVRAQRFDEWWTPYPHPNDQVTLSGKVSDLRARYKNHRGQSVPAIQLSVVQRRNDYRGYSGAPIELRDHPRSPAGMIVEDVPMETDPLDDYDEMGSNVLFALSARYVQDLTDSFINIAIAPAEILTFPEATPVMLDEVETLRRKAELGLSLSAVSLIDQALSDDIRRRENEKE